MARASSARFAIAIGVLFALQLPSVARADDPPPGPTTDDPPPPAPKTDEDAPTAPLDSHERTKTVEPIAVEPPPAKITFSADPIADGGIILGAAAFAGILELINGTGEIRPQEISPTFDRSKLLWIDRDAADQSLDASSRLTSNIGLFVAVGFAALDPVLTGVREKHVQAALVDGLIYAEAIAITWGITNLAKMAVRRPRPRAYIEAELHKNDPTYSNAETDSSLSFFSGHASMTATVATVASYLAFARSPGTYRPWLTLGVGTALTTFVSIERVRAGAHFPTDVIAGAIAGIGVGIIVAHVHRSEDVKQRRIWIGFNPERDRGGSIQLGGMF